MGWALLEGEELLAELPVEGQRPEEGSRVFFRIEALHPEVVLRMLPGDAAAARLALVMPPLPLSQEAGFYAAARDRLDSLLITHGVPEALRSLSGPEERKTAFIEAVSMSPALFAAYAESLARSRAVRGAAVGTGLVFFQHMPWLSGAVTGIEVSLWRGGEAPVFAGATLPSGDRLLLRGAVEGGTLRYRLAVASVKGGSSPQLRGFAPPKGHGEYKGLEPVRANSAGTWDLVGRILALAADTGSGAVGRFSRRL